MEAKKSYRAMTDLTVVQIERDHPGNGARNEIPGPPLQLEKFKLTGKHA
jgi:hypothetical protein